jgi:GTP cyclohydrolase IA
MNQPSVGQEASDFACRSAKRVRSKDARPLPAQGRRGECAERRSSARQRACVGQAMRECQPRPPAVKQHLMTAQITSPVTATDTAARASAQRDLNAMPASERVRHRIKASGKRFHANDNISEFIREGELPELQAEIEAKMREVLKSLVIDTESDHNTQDTAKRVAKMYLNEVFRGRYVPPPPVTEFPNVEHLNELMIVGPITIRSACSHHFCPIMGRVWIGVMPNQHSNLIGLSKYARLAEWVMSRPQIQEEAVTQLANLLQDKIQPDGLALVMEADHFCMHWRGVKDNDAKMINSVMRGSFLKDANLRREFLALVDSRKA